MLHDASDTIPAAPPVPSDHPLETVLRTRFEEVLTDLRAWSAYAGPMRKTVAVRALEIIEIANRAGVRLDWDPDELVELVTKLQWDDVAGVTSAVSR